ncbi:GNAT family N-acetyltransferase [Tessaracoccus sp. OH4464_COT-324]|uniref:GNAT family N-acetyltransferase n=1 Tax=Tessaracoccus sp. OH4464_COT-324 TaxID=2491059 RepID=UPI000F6365E0|nr:GNAT family N-acetyltransferase [Tessaracoccus sp. OH4464_COT-324]RRD46587.1 GNAT family N-acetyltransferase [Tessaracoccus sp. OH4464_COT-324]
MKLVPATVEHLAGIIELELGFAPRNRWSQAAWAEEISHPARSCTVATDGSVVGVLLLGLGDVTDLLRIVVSPEHRRRGVADRLMRELDGVGARALLEVAEDNRAAQALYAKHGFREISRRRNYYGAGVDAIIMERE